MHRESSSRRQFLQVSATLLAWASQRGRLVFGEDVKLTKQLIVHQQGPFNAEPKLADLVKEPITPLQSFYVRSHGAKNPAIDLAKYRLQIEGLIDRPLALSLTELKEKFAAKEAEATLTCAGNRRAEHSAIKKVSGVPWMAGAIGHAKWQGVALREVLEAAGLKDGAKHVWFEGLDEVVHDGHATPFGGSIPLERVMKPAAGAAPVLLAHTMNGAPLLVDHGAPLRSVVPGYIGARSVKWLGKIIVSDRPSTNFFLDGTYKLVSEDKPDIVAKASPIYENMVNSAICLPAGGDMVKAGKTNLAGYALPSGNPGAKIVKVEVAVDGQAWQVASLDAADAGCYNWMRWNASVDLPRGKHTLAVRATDSTGATQPEQPEWNAKGYLFNGWHRVPVEAS